MNLRLRAVCAASIAALALPIAGCGDDGKDEAAEKYCKAVAQQLEAAAETLDKCVDSVKNLTSKDAKDIERELKEANKELDNLPEDLKQDLRELDKAGEDAK